MNRFQILGMVLIVGAGTLMLIGYTIGRKK